MILDSVEFENEDIIITDPQDIVTGRDNWEDCCEYRRNNGRNDITDALKKLGFKKVISNDTIIGDWCCEVFKIDKWKIKLGEVCSDSGFVAVSSLAEVLKCNPDYDYDRDERLNFAVIIRNFTGRVSIEQLDDRTISVVGQGSIDFYSKILE